MKLKKPAKKTPEVLAWRPDFRDVELLPDIKVVRTSFFVSSLFVSMALALVLYVGVREVQKKNTESNIISLDADLSENRAEHSRIVGLNKKFMESMKRIEEMNSARSNQIVYSDLMLRVGELLDPKMSIGSLSFEQSGISLSGIIDVPAEEASVIVTSFMKNLEEAKVDQGFFPVYNLNNLDRRDGGGVTFSIVMSPVEDPKKKKGKKK